MKKYLFIILFFQSIFMFGQNIKQIDSITLKMCESLTYSKEVKDDTKIEMIFQKHLPALYEKFNITSQIAADSLSEKIYFRLQKNCAKFLTALNNLEENKSDWSTLSQKPKLEVSKKICANFLTGGKYYYKEYDGKLVNVIITSNSWIETFEDNTTSKLLLHPKGNCEFDLEFIESNNNIRRNYSVKGDIYNYGIFKLNDDVYYIWSTTKDNNVIYTFRLYRKK